jgi:hypothetical protein
VNWTTVRLVILVSAALVSRGSAQDTELRDLDLNHWFCLSKPAGTATEPDEQERNLLKNRNFPDVLPLNVEQLDVASFLKKVAAYDAKLKANHQADLDAAAKQQLLAFENQIVSLTGWLVLAYPGFAESTNCNDSTFHDWHLEIFPEPSDHPPQVGDPTPIICEVTPRTEKPLYDQGVRLLSLAAFIRLSDNSYWPTGHQPRKIRVTGYLMWDDVHNDLRAVGTTVTSIGSDKLHHPWRATAWEVHPIFEARDDRVEHEWNAPGGGWLPSKVPAFSFLLFNSYFLSRSSTPHFTPRSKNWPITAAALALISRQRKIEI